MSLRAQLWAWDEAPVNDAVEKLILLALADEARDDGTAACPYKEKLIERSCKSERTVQEKLRNLYQKRLIDFGDQIVGMRRYGKSARYAPRTWNLNYTATKANQPAPRTDEEMQRYSVFMQSGRTDFDEPAGGQELPPCSDQGEHEPAGGQFSPPSDATEAGGQFSPPCSDQGKRSGVQKSGVQPTAPFPIGSKTKRSKTSRFFLDYELKDQEEALALTDLDNKSFFPQDLTETELAIVDECLRLAVDDLTGLGWSARILQKVIGTPLIRKLAAQDPDVVRQAFVFAAQDPKTTTSRRLLWLEKCPHWWTAQAFCRATETRPSGEEEPSAEAGPAPAQRQPERGQVYSGRMPESARLELKAALQRSTAGATG